MGEGLSAIASQRKTAAERFYALVQVGSFSGVNAALRDELDRALGLRSAVVDVKDHRRLAFGALLNGPWGNVGPMLRMAGVDLVRHPRAAINRRFHTTSMFDHRSAAARHAVADLAPDFALQTQTMFDAHVEGVPLFIYTDHTVLANLRYPRPGESVTGRTMWIARETRAYRAAALIFTTSQFAATSLVEDYGCDPSTVVNVGSGINLPMPDAFPIRNRHPRTILFLGIDWERKGGPLLVAAFERLQARYPNIRLLVAGCSPRIRNPGVTVLGRVPSADVPKLLLDSDILAGPSWVEPSAVAYIEGAAYGLPVVATSVGGTPERVLHEETGFLGAAGDVHALEEHLGRLLDDRNLACRFGRAGFQLVGSKYTWPTVAKLMAEAIRRALPQLDFGERDLA